VLSNDKDVANHFNKYFTSIADKLESSMPLASEDPLKHVESQCNSFVCLPTTASEVLSVINSFKNKGSDLKSVPTLAFKVVAEIVSPVVADLINLSFNRGTFPNNLKVARVIPVFKAGSRDSANNYRPISTLHVLNKIFEKVMYVRLDEYIRKYSVLSVNQFGFKRGSSTVDAVLRFSDEVYNVFNSKSYLLAVMLDFSKAFDTVNHLILLGKLQKIGVRGAANDWFRSYLTNRKQFVCINGVNSELRSVTSGVPQGSILGPLLFLLYINDMSRVSRELQFVHFADDTTVFLEGSNLSELFDVMNRELDKIDKWLSCNRLSINLSKTSYMIFSNRDKNVNKTLLVRDVNISETDVTKFLGILIDNRLSFNYHIKNVCNKVSKSCGILRKLSSMIPPTVLRTLYSTLVLPHLQYGLPVWGASCRTGLARLGRLQDRVVRLFCPPAPNNLVYRNNRLLPFEDLYKSSVAIKFYQYYKQDFGNYFQNKIISSECSHSYHTRFSNNNMLNYPVVTVSKMFSSFFFRGVSIWNQIPSHIRNEPSLVSFKFRLKRFCLNA
jgi:hypothetical protein